MPNIRPPAVSGLFYPGDRSVLAHDVRAMLATAALPADTQFWQEGMPEWRPLLEFGAEQDS